MTGKWMLAIFTNWLWVTLLQAGKRSLDRCFRETRNSWPWHCDWIWSLSTGRKACFPSKVLELCIKTYLLRRGSSSNRWHHPHGAGAWKCSRGEWVWIAARHTGPSGLPTLPSRQWQEVPILSATHAIAMSSILLFRSLSRACAVSVSCCHGSEDGWESCFHFKAWRPSGCLFSFRTAPILHYFKIHA